MRVSREIVHQRGFLCEDRQRNLRQPSRFAATLFLIKQSAFDSPDALGELELEQFGFARRAATFTGGTLTRGFLPALLSEPT